MKFCGKCGQQLDDNAVVCTNCNAVVGEAPAQPVQAPVQPVQAPVQPVQAAVQPVQPPVQPVQPSVQPVQPPVQPVQQPTYAAPAAAENGDPYPENVIHKGFWWLGFILIGLIFFFIFKNSKPRLARSAMKGFITGAIVWGAIWTTSMMFAILGSL